MCVGGGRTVWGGTGLFRRGIGLFRGGAGVTLFCVRVLWGAGGRGLFGGGIGLFSAGLCCGRDRTVWGRDRTV